MKIRRDSLLLLALTEQKGQVLPWVAFMMVLFLGMGAFVLDIGHAFFCYRQLQAATDAAALAGAQQLKTTNPIATATSYSAVTGGKNTYPSLSFNGSNSVSMVPGFPKLLCLNAITAMGIGCTAPNNANAIQVKQQAIVPTFFARVFGITQMTLSTTATASLSGAKPLPTNIAVLLDTTASMTTVDSNCTSAGTSAQRIQCAEQGVQILLKDLSPCNTVLGCGSVSNGVAQYPVDKVAIFTFPNVTVGSASSDYDCSSSSPSIPVYSFPTIGSSSYAPSGNGTATYQVTPFLSDYKTTNSALSLVTSSNLTTAVGAGKNSSGTSCPGMGAPGGVGTYYAGALYAAQAALNAQQAAELAADPTLTPTNVIIILSDGEANASSTKMAPKDVSGNLLKTTWGSGGGPTSSYSNYPSALDQCQQAVAAANYAKAQGTIIYAIAYGSPSSGCTTDSTGPQPNISPCSVMSEMASTNTGTNVYFYSDYNQSGTTSTCVSAAAPVADMSDIFMNIGANFMQVRLIPDGTM